MVRYVIVQPNDSGSYEITRPDNILALIKKIFEDNAFVSTHTKNTVCIHTWCKERKVKVSPKFEGTKY